MGQIGREWNFQLAGDGVGLGNFFGLEAFAFEHVHEIGVAAEIELVSAVEAHATFAEKIGEHTMGDGRADLGFDVITNDGQTAFFETILPVGLRGDEDRDAVDESAACIKDLFDVPFGGGFGTDREIRDNHVCVRFFEDADDIVRRARRFLNDLSKIFAKAIVGHAAEDANAEAGDLCELNRVIRLGENGLAQIFSDFGFIDVERRCELDIADMVAAEIDVHEARDSFILFGVFIKLNTLDERRSAIADADNCDANFF